MSLQTHRKGKRLEAWCCYTAYQTLTCRLTCRYDTTIAPIIVHICSVLPQGKRHSRLKDGNGQLCLENRDLDDLPYKEFEKVDSWLESKVQDFQAAAGQEVKLVGYCAIGHFSLPDLVTCLQRVKLTVCLMCKLAESSTHFAADAPA